MPKVSVIIPVYNVEKYLKRCLDSVVNQTLKDIEIICINDGSTDGSLAILKEYAKKDERIKIINLETNSGAAVARNKGLEVAQGEYIQFLDADDYFDLHMFEELFNKGKSTDSDIVTCLASKFDSKTEKMINVYGICFQATAGKDVLKHNEIENNWSQIFIPSAWNKLFRTEFIKSNNLHFQNLSSCNDIGFTLKAIAIANIISIVPKVFIYYRKNTTTCISHFRGNSAINIIHAYMHVLQFLYDKRLDNLIPSLKESIKSNIEYESSHCNLFQLFKYRKEAKKFLGNDWLLLKKSFTYKFISKKWLQNLFSLINSEDRIHKIITIFGLKIKVKRLIQKNIKQFINHIIKEKSVLLVELQPCHGECLPGMAKYFIDLGYNVDVLLNYKEAALNPFSDYKTEKLNIFSAEPKLIKEILCSNVIEKYEYLYFNSDRYLEESICSYIGNELKHPKKQIITMCHHAEKYDDINFKTPNFDIVTLNSLPILKDKKYKTVNTHFFKNIKKHTKNKITKFIVVGNIEASRKNHNILIDTVKQLVHDGYTSFKIIVISRVGEFILPRNLQQYFEFKHRLPYPKMYKQLETSDFFLTLFDPDKKEHDRYIHSGTSGSYQLIYGFNIPALIPYKFQLTNNGYNDSNSIGYKNNDDLVNAMKLCINMNNSEYNQLKNNLSELEKKIYFKSLNNLKEILTTKTKLNKDNNSVNINNMSLLN